MTNVLITEQPFKVVIEGDEQITVVGGGFAGPPGPRGEPSTVSNSDGTLTISPNTGDVVASLNLAHGNTWTATQTFSVPIAGSITGNAAGTAANVTGTVAINHGGTGQTSANAAFNALAPTQTSQSGKYLTTDGSNTSWATVSGGSGSPGGVSGNLQWNNNDSFDGLAGSVVSTSGILAKLVATTATDTPLAVKGAAGQSGHVFTVLRSSDEYPIAFVDDNGAANFYSGVSCPGGGLDCTGFTVHAKYFYNSTSTGYICEIATSRIGVQCRNATDYGWTIQGAAGQSQDLLSVIDASNTPLMNITNDGSVNAPGYFVAGVAGATGSGSSVTVANGIVTAVSGGGGGSPGGASGDYQFNDGADGFAGSSALHNSGTSLDLNMTTNINANMDFAGTTLSVGGIPGFSGTGNYTTFTIHKGIITAAS